MTHREDPLCPPALVRLVSGAVSTVGAGSAALEVLWVVNWPDIGKKGGADEM